MAEISVGQLVMHLYQLKQKKNKLVDELNKIELKECAIIEELNKFYTTPPENPFELVLILKRPI